MQIAPQVRFRGMDPSDAVRTAIEKKVAKLEQYCGCITSCRVVVDAPHRHQHKGKIFSVRVDLTLPGKEIVVNRSPGIRHAHEDVYVAVRDAFGAARQKVEQYMLERHRKVKARQSPAHGRIVRIVPESDCGFIETPDGREVYFHRHSLLGKDLESLTEGMEVRFAEETGYKGPQASTVHLVGKHHSA